MKEEERVRATVKRERHVKAFAELSHANWVLLENARAQRSGCFYEYMTSILISAFKFEAYLNHVGPKLVSPWRKMERHSHRKKLNDILRQLKIQSSDSVPRYQTLKELFRFRNELAHGRDEDLDPPKKIEEGNIEAIRRKRPLTFWEELCTLEFAERAYADTEAIIREIHTAARLPDADLWREGHSYSIKAVQRLDSP